MARLSKTLTKFLSEAEIIAINEEVVRSYGGLHGVRDINLLHSAVARPRTSLGYFDAYKTVFDKAASIYHSIINNHPFLDGNKRTAFFSVILFLEYNGWLVSITRKASVKFVMKSQREKWMVEQISEWLKEHSVKISKT